MKIYLDNIVFALQKAGGISNYWSELIKNLFGSSHEFKVIEHEQSLGNIFRKKLKIREDIILKEKFPPLNVARYLAPSVKITEHSIFHSSYFRIRKHKNIANIITVYDFIYEHFSREWLKKFVHSFQKKYAIRNADGIICISESTKRDLLALVPESKEKDIKVIYLGISPEFYMLNKPVPMPERLEGLSANKYVLFLGARTKYKNFDLAVKAVGNLKDLYLIVIGGGELALQEKYFLDANLNGRYIKLENISNYDLNILYNNAFCLIYPSSYEGFGIPVIEAMNSGCPVVSTNKSSIPEVAGNAGLLVDEINESTLAEQIKLLENHEYRDNIIRLGFEQAQKFSWIKCYNETIEYYKKIFEKKLNHTAL